MGILDSLTGEPGKNAAQWSRDYLGQAGTNLIGATANAGAGASNYLRDGYAGARGDLTTGYGAATGAINTGSGSALDYLNNGVTDARGLFANARSGYTGAGDLLGNLAQTYGKGAGLYADAYGVNGAEGSARATDAFHAGPGYNFQVDQGLDAINRRRAAGGMLNSGNADRDAQTFGQGVANQEFNNWRTGLAPYNNLQLTATTGQESARADAARANAGLYGQEAGLVDSAGRAKAGVAAGQGSSLADIANRYYGGQAALSTGEGTAQASNTMDANRLATGIGMGILPQVTKTYGDEAKAATDASGNVINLGVNLAKLAAGGLGSLSGGGGSSFLPSSSFNNNSWGW